MTLHTDRPNRIMSLPTVQIGTGLAVLLADYLGDQEKDQGYDGPMRRAADHRIYDRISRRRTASYLEVTTVAVVRKLLPVADRTHMAKALGMSFGDLENELTLALLKACETIPEHCPVACHAGSGFEPDVRRKGHEPFRRLIQSAWGSASTSEGSSGSTSPSLSGSIGGSSSSGAGRGSCSFSREGSGGGSNGR